MIASPAGDWTIKDVETLCKGYGIRISAPSGGGSHFKVSHPSQTMILTIPYRKPVKGVYIKKLTRFVVEVAVLSNDDD